MSNLKTTIETYRKIAESDSNKKSERSDAREKLYELALEYPAVRDDVLTTFQRIALDAMSKSERSDARDKLFELASKQDVREQVTREVNKRNQEAEEDVSEEMMENSARAANYDAFICHASENKEEFVRPLANELTELGLSIWYDEFELEIGDSIRESIDHGLTNSESGIVILSHRFFDKDWPMYELNGLTSKEIQTSGEILPVWYEINEEEIMEYSPALADKVAIPANSDNVEETAEQLYSILKD